jgi:hypothetical protein
MIMKSFLLFHLVLSVVFAAGHGDGRASASQRGAADRLKQVISPEEAHRHFAWLRADRHFANITRDGGCHPRAHVACFLLDTEREIYSRTAKVSCGSEVKLSPRAPWNAKGEIGWGSHIAPLVRVKNEARMEEWVFDLLFEEPLPYSEWLRRLQPDGMDLARDARVIDPADANRAVPSGKCVRYFMERFQDEGPEGGRETGWDREFIEGEKRKLLR